MLSPADLPSPHLVERVRARLVQTGREPSTSSVASALRDEGAMLGNGGVLAVLDQLRSELLGFGPLDRLIRDEGVTDVLVNGPDEIYVDRGDGLERVVVRLADEAAVRRLAQRLASSAGRRLDDASPWVDARLEGGVRLHAVLPPVATAGTLISLRIPRRRAFSIDELVTAGTMTAAVADVLCRLVRARASFLISGGTGTGKTTVLATLLGLVEPNQRIVLVEDTAELQPAHPHVVRLEARPPNVEGAGSVSLQDLVRQGLRMRPDRLVVGEVRGAEVVDLMAALNTGHEGGCGTVHANSAADVPARIEALAATAGLMREAVHTQLASAVDVVIALARDEAGRRSVTEICVLDRDSTGIVHALPAVGAAGRGPGFSRLRSLLAPAAPSCGGDLAA